MKWYKSERSRTGGFLTTEWSANEMFGAGMFEFIIKFGLLAFLSIIASFLLIFVRLYDYEENEKGPQIWGIITSVYFIIDMKCQLVVHFFLNMFSGIDKPFWLRFNIAALIIHLIILFFGDAVFYGIDKPDRQRKRDMSIMALFVMMLLCKIIHFFI